MFFLFWAFYYAYVSVKIDVLFAFYYGYGGIYNIFSGLSTIIT